MNHKFPIDIHEEVKDALNEGRAVVALESTVISHGLPHPKNIEVTYSMMTAIREHGAVPALIAIADGSLLVGANSSLIERLSDKNSSVRKVSRRDIAFCLAKKELGATTVSATMIASALAGIRIFATGGIGGVHRGAETSMDISADLAELAKTPVAVVCAGAKSILDIAKTLELLESLGVPVFGYDTNYFPEFYCRGTKHRLHMRANTPLEIAEILRLHFSLDQGGAIVAQEIDASQALSSEFVEEIIIAAESEAHRVNKSGADLTPFLLREIAIRSDNKSIASNCALLINNARLAADIAKAYENLNKSLGF